jgi:hypothetical protein
MPTAQAENFLKKLLRDSDGNFFITLTEMRGFVNRERENAGIFAPHSAYAVSNETVRCSA